MGRSKDRWKWTGGNAHSQGTGVDAQENRGLEQGIAVELNWQTGSLDRDLSDARADDIRVTLEAAEHQPGGHPNACAGPVGRNDAEVEQTIVDQRAGREAHHAPVEPGVAGEQDARIGSELPLWRTPTHGARAEGWEITSATDEVGGGADTLLHRPAYLGGDGGVPARTCHENERLIACAAKVHDDPLTGEVGVDRGTEPKG